MNMTWKFTEHKDEIITSIVKNFIWGIIATCASLLTLVLKNVFIYISKGILSAFDIVTIILLIFALICLSIEQKSLKPQDKSYELFKQFHAKEMEAELYFESRESLLSRITYQLTVSSPNPIDSIHRSLTWTGNQYNGTTLIDTNGNYTIEDSVRKASPYEFVINFNEAKTNGSFIKFTTETSVSDDDHDMNPHYSFMIKYQIDRLTLHITVPTKLNLIKNVRASVYADVAREIIVKQPTTVIGERVGSFTRYTYTFESPTFLHNYFLEWDFTRK